MVLSPKFNFKRYRPRRGGSHAPKFSEPTAIFNKTQIAFNEAFVEKIIEKLGIKLGDKARMCVDYDEELHAVAFYPMLSKHPESISFSLIYNTKAQYRVVTFGLYKAIPGIWKRVQEIGRNYFPIIEMKAQDPDPEFGELETEMYVVFLQFSEKTK